MTPALRTHDAPIKTQYSDGHASIGACCGQLYAIRDGKFHCPDCGRWWRVTAEVVGVDGAGAA
jgi:hypothetical protein